MIFRREADILGSPGIAHGFFGRQGGVSSGLYAGLNCGQGSHDEPSAIETNRGMIAPALGMPGSPLLTPWQVHGATAVTVSAPWPPDAERPRADAIVTAMPGLVLGVLTADCAPILFADPEARVIAAAHAGWRGALSGIVEATIAAMESLGAARTRIRGAVGPCLSQANYQIGPEFRASFVADNTANQRYFQTQPDGSTHFDLPAYVTDRLSRLGIGTIANLARCTYADTEAYFSYRRATHRKEADYGRQISAIVAE